ncbi:MAG: hypothetical protein QGI60_02670 [archaeon]|jgi:hypothetical protein|nr:hypothetical protein [archaeon]
MRKKKKVPEGHLDKPGDKAWNDWYEKLDVKEHEKYLSQLGLDKEDIEEWEEVEGFKKPKPEPKPKPKKK